MEILCDTKGLPIYVDGHLVGYSPLKNPIDVLPGWHKVGYFPNDYTQDNNALTSKEKIMNDILVMGRLDVYVDEGAHETIALNYQTLGEEVVDIISGSRQVPGLDSLIFCNNFIDELGVSLKIREGFLFNLIFLFSFNEVYALDKNPDQDSYETVRIEYYKYWNPYRQSIRSSGEPQSFYGQIYYQATYNKDNRIKTVTRFGKDRKPKETYSLLWSRSGARSEYKVTFHELGNVSRLDQNLIQMN